MKRLFLISCIVCLWLPIAKGQEVLNFIGTSFAPSSPSSFTPASIPSCALWLTFQQGAGANGSSPYGWTNQISPYQIFSNSYSGVTNSAAYGVFFPGTGYMSNFNNSIQFSNTTGSAWVAFVRTGNNGSGFNGIVTSSYSSSCYGIGIRGAAGTGAIGYDINGSASGFTSGTLTSTLYSFSLVAGGQGYTNGVATSSVSLSDPTASTVGYIGAAVGATIFIGYILDVAVFPNHALTSTEISELNTYVQNNQ